MSTTLSTRCVFKPQPVHSWPVYLVSVFADWEPISWKALPISAKRFRTPELAAKVCVMLNRDRLDRSEDGIVRSWHIRIRSSAKHGIIAISIPNGFEPKDEYDLPEPYLELDNPMSACKVIVSNLNKRLRDKVVSKDGLRVDRAFIALSIRPEHVQLEPETILEW